VAGKWASTEESESVVDCLNGDIIMHVPKTGAKELSTFVDSMASCPKSGLHNPFKNVARYVKLGEISDRIANAMKQPAIADFFAKLTMRVSPKSYAQALGEVRIVWQFLDNFSGDNVRYLARGFTA
jgi:1-pyrroline-5-carboxylate dehydrogenase